jgi:hypothetical protein
MTNRNLEGDMLWARLTARIRVIPKPPIEVAANRCCRRNGLFHARVRKNEKKKRLTQSGIRMNTIL